MNCITYTACEETASFGVSSELATVISKTGTYCDVDFVEIIGGTGCGNSNLINRFCGTAFSAGELSNSAGIGMVCDCLSPFTVTFVTDSIGAEGIAPTVAGNSQRGFCLEYNQVANSP
jgi:hypothetical protein